VKFFIIVALALLAGCVTPEPQLQKVTRALAPLQGCASTDLINKSLLKRYGERRQEIGLHQDGNTLVTLFTSGGGKTWTITLTSPNGISCSAMAGYHWANAPLEP
jgi:uncharacterized lipoprotein YajG|tara:strand:+ start:112 stop:426 length:315 start_codon:yes stop_codon:yes gene_type:complete